MFRYFKIFLLIAKRCLIRVFEFRVEFLSWVIMSSIWSLIALLLVQLIYGQIDSIAGWTREEAMVVVLLNEIFISILWLFVFPSIFHLNTAISEGNFDFYMVKPINLRFLSSVSWVEYDQYPKLIIFCFLFVKFVGNTGAVIGVGNLVGFLVLFLLGLVIFYCFFFAMVTFSFWFTNLFNLEDLFDTILDSARYPLDIFKGSAKILFTFMIPLAFIATFPAKILLNKAGPELLFEGLIVVIVLFIFSHWFWNFALRHYTSASS